MSPAFLIFLEVFRGRGTTLELWEFFPGARARKAPPFGQRRCRLLGFWGTSGEEINEEMRWDGMLR